MYKWYIRLDANNNIIYGFSDAFEQPLSTDICINESADRQFELLGVVNPQLSTMNGLYFYQYISGNVVYNANPVPTLAVVQQAKIAQINSAYASALDTKFTSNATGAILTYDYSEASQMSFAKLAIDIISGMGTYPVDIMLSDGLTYAPHTQAQCQLVLESIGAFEGPIRAKKEAFLKAVAAATTVDQVNAITIQF
jgi:hypothetical protein